MTKQTTVKVGKHRNAPRLWLEGKKLLNSGFARGDRYDIEIVDSALLITANNNGKRVISGRSRDSGITYSPIIDAHSLQWAAMFPGWSDNNGRALIEYAHNGRGTIRVTNNND